MPNVYEYQRVRCLDDDAPAELSKLGADGWRLVSGTSEVTITNNPATSRNANYFTGLVERERDAEVVKKEQADAKAKADKDAKDKAEAATKEADAKIAADKVAKAALDKAAADKAVAQKAAPAQMPVAPGAPVGEASAGAKP
jgi:hypothetical protein